MNRYSEIKHALRQVARTEKTVYDFMTLKVKEVKGDVCDCYLEDIVVTGVRLAALAGGSKNGLLIKPKKESFVEVADLSAGKLRELMVVGYTEIESITYHHGDTTVFIDGEKIDAAVGDQVAVVIEGDKIDAKVGGSTIEVTDSLIKINGGELGLCLVDKLVDRIDTFISAFNSHTHLIPAKAVGISLDTLSNLNPVNVPAILSPHSEIGDSKPYQDEKVTH